MADIELIIKLPEEVWEYVKNGIPLGVSEYVKNGTPLPEGHGRLIDADELKKKYPHDTDWDYPVNTNSYVVESIDNSPTIIEAESEDKV